MRCPACGARNPDGAAWCSQCFVSLGPDRADGHVATSEGGPDAGSAAGAAGAVGGVGTPEGGAGSAEGSGAAAERAATGDVGPVAAVVGTAGRFRRTGEGVEWACPSCDGWNPIEASACLVCATPFQRSLGADGDEPPLPEVAPGALVAASVALPGAGHLWLGRTASGIGRAVLYVVWAVGGVLLLQEAADSDQSALASLPLLAGALVLLVTSVLDVLAIQRGDDREILSPRALLWLTVGVIGLTMLTLLASVLTVGS